MLFCSIALPVPEVLQTPDSTSDPRGALDYVGMPSINESGGWLGFGGRFEAANMELEVDHHGSGKL